MTRPPARRFFGLVPLVLAASLVACASGTPGGAPQAPAAAASGAPPTIAPATTPAAAPAQPGKKPAAAPPAAVAASIQKSRARVARPIPDPEQGKSFKASQYWDYELGTPYEIEDTTITSLGDADKDGRNEIKVVADVKLPNAKVQAKLMLLGKYALTQADDDLMEDDPAEDDFEDDGDADDGEDAFGSDDLEGDELASDEVFEDDDAESDDDAEDASDDDAIAEADDDEELDFDIEFDFDDWETEIDLAEVDEEIGEDEDDITWEDDWLVDLDGDGEWEEGDDEAYAEEFGEEEEDTFLTAPHRCEMSIQDAEPMSNDDDVVTITDTDTGETLTISYDQEWVHFTVKTSKGQGTIEYLPDGSFLVDGRPVADPEGVAKSFQGKPWFRVTSRYTLGLLAARLGRLADEATRAPMSIANVGAYRLNQGAAMSEQRRSFAIVNALVAGEP